MCRYYNILILDVENFNYLESEGRLRHVQVVYNSIQTNTNRYNVFKRATLIKIHFHQL